MKVFFNVLRTSNAIAFEPTRFPSTYVFTVILFIIVQNFFRTKSNQRWMKLRTTVQISSAIQKVTIRKSSLFNRKVSYCVDRAETLLSRKQSEP